MYSYVSVWFPHPNIFFRDPFAAHQEHMRSMFSEPFGRDQFLPIKGGGVGSLDQRGRADSRVALRDNHKVRLFIRSQDYLIIHN